MKIEIALRTQTILLLFIYKVHYRDCHTFPAMTLGKIRAIRVQTSPLLCGLQHRPHCQALPTRCCNWSMGGHVTFTLRVMFTICTMDHYEYMSGLNRENENIEKL